MLRGLTRTARHLMAGLCMPEALTRYKYDARFTLKKEGEKNVLPGALKRSDIITHPLSIMSTSSLKSQLHSVLHVALLSILCLRALIEQA